MPNVKTIIAQPVSQITPACEVLSHRIQASRAVLRASMSRSVPSPASNPRHTDQAIQQDEPMKQVIKTVGLSAWQMLEPEISQRVKQKPLDMLGLAFVLGFVVVTVVLKPKHST